MTDGTEKGARSSELARAILDVVPLVTRSIRAEMRALRSAELSVPQFRVLAYVERRGSVSLSDISEHIGLTLSSMSTMVDGMVGRGLLDRRLDAADRRKVAIGITPKGRGRWTAARDAACASLAIRVRELDASRQRELLRSLETLRALFSEESDINARAAGKEARDAAERSSFHPQSR